MLNFVEVDGQRKFLLRYTHTCSSNILEARDFEGMDEYERACCIRGYHEYKVLITSVSLCYNNYTCNVHTKTAVLNALLLTLFTASPCQEVCQSKQSPSKQGGGGGYHG